MPVQITTVSSKKHLREFIDFPAWLYKGVDTYVPALYYDEIDCLSKDRNPAFEFCKAEYYLAYKDGKLAGRVAAIVNDKANEQWNHKEVRFGWFDFIDDKEVSQALLDKVIEFGRNQGMTKVCGPLGFTDFDPEGMLVSGFDKISTMTLHTNFPYYAEHMESFGYEKEIDWLEYRISIPDEMPEKYSRIAAIVCEKYGVRLKKLNKKDFLKKGWGEKLFNLINETYSQLYDFTILPKKMRERYLNKYIALLDPRFVATVVDGNDVMIGFGIMMPSLAGALKKSNGKLFPFGWWHLFRSMYVKYEDTVELLLIGIKQEYQKKGINAIIFNDLFSFAIKKGFKFAESNAELEDNISVRAQWTDLEYDQSKRRRVFFKEI